MDACENMVIHWLLVACLLTTLFKLENVLTLQHNDTRKISRTVGAKDLEPGVLALAQSMESKKKKTSPVDPAVFDSPAGNFKLLQQ